MAQPQLMQIKLSRFDAQPWGFRLQGGVDFAAPLLVQKVNGGSLAEQAGLMPGDAVIKINDVDVFSLRHKDAQDVVVRSGNNFVITIQRGGSTWRPHVTPTGQMPQPNSPYLQTVTKTSLAHKQPQDSQHIGCGYNNAAKPFGNGVDGNVKSIVNKQYNSPVGIYSDESIAETLSAQAEVLAGGVLGVNFKKNEKEYQAEKSEVLKFLREEESGQSTPEPHSTSNFYWTKSHAIGHQREQQDERIGTPLQQNTLAPDASHRPSLPTAAPKPDSESSKPPMASVPEGPDPRLIVMPVCPALQTPEYKEEMEAAAAAAALGPDGQPRPLSASGHPPCSMCGVGIVGVFVRIKDRNLHVECFKCATCGTSLKNQGYYNFNNKLYCDIHAKLAAMQNPPAGTEGYVPVPMKPNTKLSATTISSALSAHGFNNGVSNGSSPAPAPVNQGGYARPYGAAPPAAAPKSPVSYPPQQQQWNQPPPTQPKPAGGNAYATLPRSNVGQQEEASEESLQPQYAETYFEEDYEVEQANRQQRMNFCWPPTHDDSHRTPTAAPLYIPPPETQHIVAKPIENPPPPPPGNVQQQQHQQQQQCQQCEYAEEVVQQLQQQQHQQQQQAQWQSRSAPQLTVQQQQQLECESGSDSYTSTSTTTTTTSEEYQRMYAAQVQAYQMQQAFEQSGSELDYNMDMEVAAMQQQERLQLCSSEYMESGRRSAQECRDALAPPLSTYKLVDMVREVTPSPVPRDNQGSRHVVFLEDTDVKEIVDQQQEMQGKQEEQLHLETQESSYVEEREEEYQEEGFIRDDRSHILESERIFQPTPEIKFEIAPVKQIPPTKIPNPCPKEWINPMVRVLTTAPETPFHMVNCLCPKPCDDCCCQLQPEVEVAKEIPEEPPKEPIPEPYERPLSPTPEPEPVEINTIWNTPTLSKAMTIAPDFELKFVPPASECIPLPEETEPYMPPPIVVKPFVREDYRPKTPLLRALTTAPEKPFEGQFDGDVPIHVLDLPTPKETLTMSDALRTAPERPYTPLNPENAMLKAEEQKQEEEKKKYEFQVLDKEEELGLSKEALEQVEYYTTEKRKSSTSAFAAMQAFQPSSQPLSSNTTTTPRHSLTYTKGENDLEYRKYHDAHERYQKRRSFFSQKEQELQQQQLQEQTNTTSQQQHQQQTREESSLYSSTKASSSTSNTSSAVQQQQQTLTSSYASNLTQASKSCYSSAYENADSCVTSKKLDVHEIIEEVAEELEHSEVLFPPPSPLSHLKQHKPSSGLHKPESIPKYQRNWTVLPTQSPIRTPEPQELRENVPLAFVDTPKTPCNTNETYGNTVHKPVARTSQQQSTATAYSSAITSSQTEQRQQQQQHSTITSSSSVTASSSAAKHQQQQQLQITKPTIPIIIEDRSGPVTMAFQALDEHMVRDQSQTPSRPYTPSMINKPAPITPYYQTPEKLCFYEEAAPHARAYDRRSASPFPDRARSPAPGPPPNPLAAIRAPRIKDTEASSSLAPRNLQAGSITTGQSYLGAQQAQQQERLLSHTSTGMQSAMHSYTEEPEKRQELQIGNMTMQRSEKASHLEEQKQSQMQSHTTSQVGNTQIERRRKVTEEFEHTSSAKTVEIRTGSQSSSERRQSYGKTGYVANQARRLSGLEQEITDLTSQAQAITARAATMTDTKFPEFHSQGGQAKFPTKPVFPHDDEPQAACPYVSAAVNKKLVDPCYQYQQNRKKSVSPMYGASLLQLQKQQQQQQQQQKSLTTISSSQQHQQQANTVSSSLTKANATSTTNNQAYQSITAGSSNLNATSTTTSAIATSSPSSLSTNAGAAPASGVCPVTGTFCRPGHTCCKQQQLQTSTKNNNGSRPTASLGSAAGVKPPHAPASNIIANTQAQATAAPAPTASTTPSVSSNNNNKNDDSNSGGMAPKGGAYGATSAPKRGRGILNKAAAPGVRVPLCNSCSTQIRGPFITALGKIWCPEHFHCFNGNCRRPLQDIGFVEEKGDLYCEYCFEKYLAPTCSKCAGKIKGDCLNAIGKHFHPECFSCGHCGKLFGNTPFFLEDGMPYCEADWNELFTTKCFACGFPVEAGDRWVEALNHNYHSQCFNCTYCKQNLEGQSFYNKGGRPFCKNHAR